MADEHRPVILREEIAPLLQGPLIWSSRAWNHSKRRDTILIGCNLNTSLSCPVSFLAFSAFMSPSSCFQPHGSRDDAGPSPPGWLARPFWSRQTYFSNCWLPLIYLKFRTDIHGAQRNLEGLRWSSDFPFSSSSRSTFSFIRWNISTSTIDWYNFFKYIRSWLADNESHWLWWAPTFKDFHQFNSRLTSSLFITMSFLHGIFFFMCLCLKNL